MKTGSQRIIFSLSLLATSFISYSQVVYKEYPLTVNMTAIPSIYPSSIVPLINIDLDEDGTPEFSLDAGTSPTGGYTIPDAYSSSTSMVDIPNGPVLVPASFTQCLSNNAIPSFGVALHNGYVYSINYKYLSSSGLHSFSTSNLDFKGYYMLPSTFPMNHSHVSSSAVPYLVNASHFESENIKGFMCLVYNEIARLESTGGVCATNLQTGSYNQMANNYYPFRIKMKNSLYHYGWLQLAGSGTNRTLRIAYEATAEAPIITGQTGPLTHCDGLANFTLNLDAPAICQTSSGYKYYLTLTAPQSSNYSYQWRKDGSVLSGATTYNHSTTIPGDYDVIITDIANMCKDTSEAINAFTTEIPAIYAGKDTTICEGASVHYEPVASGNGPFTFLWETVPGLTISNPEEANQNLAPGQSSYILLNAYDVYGCRNYDTIIIDVLPTSPVSLSSSGTICPPDPSNKVAFSFSNTISHLYKNDIPYNLSASEIATGNIETTSPGEFYVVRNNACGSVQSNKVNIPACIDYATISGIVFNDLNNDGVKDTGEDGVPDILIQAGQEDYAITNSNGEYLLYVSAAQTYEVEMIKPFDIHIQTLPAGFHQVVVPATGIHDFSGRDFGLYQPPFKDLQVNVTSSLLRPGFSTHYFIHCKNLGTEALSGRVDFIYNPQLNFDHAIPVQSTHNTGIQTLSFELASLAPGATHIIEVSFIASVTLPLGSLVTAFAEGIVSETDIDLFNNTDTASEIVVGSYDPNDKSVSPKGQGEDNYIKTTDKLIYTIRFQNTGTYYAYNVIVKDTIDESLDLASFKSIALSHNCDVCIDSNRVITWSFNGIMLPDSNRNEKGSHGFIRFSFKQHSIPKNTVIKNKAYIYFDFNEPIITNETTNKVNDNMLLSNMDKGTSDAFEIYPNPAGNYLAIHFNSQEVDYFIMDLNGRIMKQGKTSDRIDISDLYNGMYLIKLESKEAVSYRRFIKQ